MSFTVKGRCQHGELTHRRKTPEANRVRPRRCSEPMSATGHEPDAIGSI
jgi:hypothetical protein